MDKGQLTELREFITKTVKETVTEAVSISEARLREEMQEGFTEMREGFTVMREGFKAVAVAFEELDKTQGKIDKMVKRHTEQLDRHGELILQLQSPV